MKTLPVLCLLVAAALAAAAQDIAWPQFRGPNGAGFAPGQKPPTSFSPSSNLVWRIPVPPGASSPCIWGDRIFLTAFEQGKLSTLCLRRSDGQFLWQSTALADKIESFHPQEGSPAASTPATDGERVYVYFGSCGLLCYDLNGKELWRLLLPMAQTFGGFGSGASPVVADGLVLLNRDQLSGSELLAVEAQTGRIAWRANRGQSFGWCTPAVWEHDGTKEVILPASAELKAYNLKTGTERWTLHGIAAATCSTPVAGDGLLFVSSWTTVDASNAPPPFAAMLEKLDNDHDEALSMDEAKDSDIGPMFQTIDLNKDGRVSRDEYDQLRSLALHSKNILLAVRPGGNGDITGSHVAWSQTKGLPYVSSPLYYQGRLYLVKDGGLVSCFEGQSGKPLYLLERLGALGSYYASPIAADGRIYATSLQGVITVFESGDALHILAQNDLGERISATPAMADHKLYVRTAKHLFAFGAPASPASGASAPVATVDETDLFDGKSLRGWRESSFTGSGKVKIENGKVILGTGYMTGITWTNDIPHLDYELSLDAMRVEGSDFFCGLTFPVAESSCSLIVGGWGGSIVGLSSLDYADAANNETTRSMQFDNGRWYHIRVRVEPDRIQAWIDGKSMADVKTTGRKVSIRSECEPSLPMGIATYSTTAAVGNIKLRRF